MPELPEVETVRRGLALKMSGRRIVQAELRRPDLRRPFPPALASRLDGARIGALGRRGKYILIELDADGVAAAASRHVGPGHGGQPPLCRTRRTTMWCCGSTTAPSSASTIPAASGCSTMSSAARRHSTRYWRGSARSRSKPEFNGAYLAAALAGKMTPIKSALLDQRIVAGLGNIYVCEALFRSGVSPRRLAASIGRGRAERLVAGIRSVLTEAIEAGGSSLRDYVQADGELGYFQHRWAVYGHEGDPCPGCDCGGAVRRIVQSGRSTFFCAKRQR